MSKQPNERPTTEHDHIELRVLPDDFGPDRAGEFGQRYMARLAELDSAGVPDWYIVRVDDQIGDRLLQTAEEGGS